MSKSLIICWTMHADYPPFRAWLDKYYSWFDEIIIYWSPHNRFPYFNSFIQSSLQHIPNIKFLDPIETDWGTQDWRNIATNEMLKHATGDWIISIEQDWFTQDWPKLLATVQLAMETNEMVGWDAQVGEGYYIHPAFFFIKRELLEKTHKDFAAHDALDHFGWITRDVQQLGGRIFGLEKDEHLNCTVSPEANSFHGGGINFNYLNGMNPDHPFHQEEFFYIYNYWCRKMPVIQDPKFTLLSLNIEAKLKVKYPNLDLEDNGFVKFLKHLL